MKKYRFRRAAVAVTVLIFFGLTLLALRPVPSAKTSNCSYIKSVVVDMHQGEGENDIVFVLENDRNEYYINRGLEHGLDIEKLKNRIEGQEIELLYIRYWTPIFTSAPRHIAEISLNQEIIYSEFND